MNTEYKEGRKHVSSCACPRCHYYCGKDASNCTCPRCHNHGEDMLPMAVATVVAIGAESMPRMWRAWLFHAARCVSAKCATRVYDQDSASLDEYGNPQRLW